MASWMPAYRFKRLADITIEDFYAMGAQGVALDVDNTTAYDSSPELIEGVADWVSNMRAQGFPMVIVSNGFARRVQPIAAQLKLAFISFSVKPLPFGFRRAAKLMGIPVEKMAVVGDQLMTDIQGANACGAIPVYVDPARQEERLIKLFMKRRKREQPVLERFEREQAARGRKDGSL